MTQLEKAARALLKRRWYDCEPEAWHDLETFYAQIDPDHVFEAYDEARAVFASIEVDDAMVEAGAEAAHTHWQNGLPKTWAQITDLEHGMPGQAKFFRDVSRAALKAFLRSLLEGETGK